MGLLPRPRTLLAGSIASGAVYLYLNFQTPVTSLAEYQQYLSENPLMALALDGTMILTGVLFGLSALTYIVSKI